MSQRPSRYIARSVCQGSAFLAVSLIWAGQLHAQVGADTVVKSSDDIIVTATKKAGGAAVQDVPIAMTAFGTDQLADLNFRKLENLGDLMPNVQLNSSNAIPGTANFSIRGLGIASTIASIEPTVGLFVDGVYVGVTTGALFDNFDVEGIEVLRGPQGILFGKNVTGGAVLLRTTTPGDIFKLDAQVSAETGINYTAQTSISGPVNDMISLKVAAYYNHDDGWFRNQATGRSYGQNETWLLRGAARLRPGDGIDIVARYEHGETDRDSDSPVQNRAKYSADSFKVEGSDTGSSQNSWNNAVLQADIELGNGNLTSITGYRDLKIFSNAEIDGLSQLFFESLTSLKQKQVSEELRYFITAGTFDLTAGLYYFHQDIDFVEKRALGNGIAFLARPVGGGEQKTETWGGFVAADWHVADKITVNLGGRYTTERKSVGITGVYVNSGCTPKPLFCPNSDFVDSARFEGFTPKVGIQWQPNRDMQVYALWTKGLRGGGYNLRNTGTRVDPGPFGDEKQTAIEAGIKTDLAEGAVRLNVALFHSKVKGLQREINSPDPVAGIIQVIRNTADATYQGVEIDSTFHVTDRLTLTSSVGVIEGNYDAVYADLNRDGILNVNDRNLKIPRLSPLSYSIGGAYRTEAGFGSLLARLHYSYRDPAFYSDANDPVSRLSSVRNLEASLAVGMMDKRLTFTLYGRNLLNDVNEEYSAALPATFGGPGATYTGLQKGRVIGISARYTL